MKITIHLKSFLTGAWLSATVLSIALGGVPIGPNNLPIWSLLLAMYVGGLVLSGPIEAVVSGVFE